MKKFNIILALFISSILFFISCDKVDEPYLKPIGVNNDTIPVQEKIRKVLLEEFTGHKCPNCPEGTELAHNLKGVYGDQLILIAIHAGFYAAPSSDPFQENFQTAEGTEFNDFFQAAFYPSGMVNRTEYNGAKVMGKDDWESAISAIIDQAPDAGIVIANTYDPANRNLHCRLETSFFNNLDGTYNISAFLIESGIVAPQQSDTGIIMDYEHDHMLRASLNGTWGDLIGADGSATVGDVAVNEYSFDIPEAFNADNCSIVAFIYDTSTYDIIQADEEPVK